MLKSIFLSKRSALSKSVVVFSITQRWKMFIVSWSFSALSTKKYCQRVGPDGEGLSELGVQ